MKLRHAHLAAVERHNVVDDLLNSAHPDNGGKAQFFESLGFSVDGAVSSHTESRQSRMVRTVWIVDRGLNAPRLVTASPGKE